jgi:hypothetical protein
VLCSLLGYTKEAFSAVGRECMRCVSASVRGWVGGWCVGELVFRALVLRNGGALVLRNGGAVERWNGGAVERWWCVLRNWVPQRVSVVAHHGKALEFLQVAAEPLRRYKRKNAPEGA